MSPSVAPDDRRKIRTRQAILGALTQLMFTRRYGAIRTADLIETAGVGRSTFYDHFRSRDEVLVALVDPLFAPLADAAAGRGDVFAVEAVLNHLWEQRAVARHLFEPPLGPRLSRKLADMIAERVEAKALAVPPTLAATGAAAGTLAVLRAWLTGETPCLASDLAWHLVGVEGKGS